MHGRIKPPYTSPQVIGLNLNCSQQAHSNRPSTAHEYESTEPGRTLTVLHVLPMVRPLAARMQSMATSFPRILMPIYKKCACAIAIVKKIQLATIAQKVQAVKVLKITVASKKVRLFYFFRFF